MTEWDKEDTGRDPTTAVRVTIDLRVMAGKLQETLQHAIDLVTFGLDAAGRGGDVVEPLPVLVSFSPASNLALPVEEARKRFIQWLVAAQLRDCIEGFKSYLDEVGLVCRVYRATAEGGIKAAAWNRLVNEESKRFHKLGLPHKVDFLRREFAEDVVPEAVDLVLGINRARNCLVHRKGIVSEQDLAGSEALTISWLAQEIGVETEEGEEIIHKLPFHAEAGGRVFMRNRPAERVFLLGETISFDAAEFAEICWTIFLVCGDINKGVEAFGRGLGHPFVDVPLPEDGGFEGDSGRENAE